MLVQSITVIRYCLDYFSRGFKCSFIFKNYKKIEKNLSLELRNMDS